ncbi:hypothetical protein IC229_27745 [Spirosoma sp. BT702]|uniref:DUF3592 domain-containing protein n=1 Tax=Spirosoma profusum TaxID=2771354 RepID=A0A926Y5C0_9BACT|nr:hypothetical protein [Spirosoma profusum]MBD2704465.1 hypothetical protein [Spirosoma profusum]
METNSANKLITNDSDKNLAPVFPNFVPFSEADKAKVKSFMQQMIWAWVIFMVGTILFGLCKGHFSRYNSDDYSMNYFFLILGVSTIWGCVLLQQRQDTKIGVKQAGQIEVLSKNTHFRNNGGTSYQVEFKWLADPKEETVSITDGCFYDYLDEGDVAYLELLPITKQVLLVQKQASEKL